MTLRFRILGRIQNRLWSSLNKIIIEIQGQRMPCNSEGAQGPGMRTISHLGGSGGMLPQENFKFLTPKAFLRLSESSFVAYF